MRLKLADGKWNPEARVLEGAFGRAYRRYRIDGRPRMDPNTYFNRIRSQLIITLRKEFKGRSVKVHNLSEVEEIVDEMINHMKEQVENPALLNSRCVFDEILFMDIDFHQLNLTRGSSCIPLPQWFDNKKAVINPHNEDQERFKWAIIAASRWEEISKNPQQVSNLKNTS